MARPQVMVVEDEGIVALSLEKKLLDLGYGVPAIATTEEEAVRRAREARPDIVLMDIMLAGASDGVAAAREIRAELNLPIVYLTAYSDAQTIERAKATQPFGYLIKPFEERELHATIEMALAKHRMETEMQQQCSLLQHLVNQQMEQLLQSRELAEAAQKAKKTFLHNMSHEIRTPLNGVLGTMELLRLTALDERQKYYVEMLHRSGSALLGLVNEILDFASLEAGRVRPATEPLDVRQLVDELQLLHSTPANHKSLLLKMSVAPEVPALMETDRFKLRQILSNLIGNALKFTDQGWVSVDVGMVASGAHEGQVLFAVSDTGRGIPTEAQGRIFGLFEQVDDSPSRRHGGTGLGLAVCKKLVKLMGGETGFASTPGTGSRFWFTLPVAPGREAYPRT